MKRAHLTILILCLLWALVGCPCKKKSPTQPPRGNDPAAGRVEEEPDWSPDGQTIAFVHCANFSVQGDSISGIYFVDSDGSNRRLFFRCAWETAGVYRGLIYDPRWSPDGQWLVFSMGAQIWKVKVNGDSLTQLTTEGRNFYPDWSPGGTKIAYDAELDTGMTSIFVMDANGSNKSRLIGARQPSWSPDGAKIIYQGWTSGTSSSEIFIMDADGQNPRNLTNELIGNDGVPEMSPDGSKIIFERQMMDNTELYPRVWVMDADGSNQRKLSEGAAEGPSWSPDSKKIVFMNLLVDGKLWTMDPDGSDKKPLTP